MESKERMSVEATVKFTNEVNELPLPYVNALSVQSGIDDFFVTVGAVVPPEIKSEEDLKSISELVAKPLFRFALSRSKYGATDGYIIRAVSQSDSALS